MRIWIAWTGIDVLNVSIPVDTNLLMKGQITLDANDLFRRLEPADKEALKKRAQQSVLRPCYVDASGADGKMNPRRTP